MTMFTKTAGVVLVAIAAWCLQASPSFAALLYHYTFDNDNLANSGSGVGTVTEEGTIAYINGAPGLGRAASFNGSTNSFFSTNATELDWSDLTVSMVTRTPSAANFDDWWSLGSVANQQFWESNGIGGGSLFASGSPPSGSFSNAQLTAGSAVRDSDWHFVTFTFSQADNEALLYVDGVQVDSTTWNASGAFSAFQIASRLGAGAVRRIDADIDDVRIYDEALTAIQVRALIPVPEPATFGLILLGLCGLSFRRRRR